MTEVSLEAVSGKCHDSFLNLTINASFHAHSISACFSYFETNKFQAYEMTLLSVYLYFYAIHSTIELLNHVFSMRSVSYGIPSML